MELHKGSVVLKKENENEIPFEKENEIEIQNEIENELPEELVKRLKFQVEYEKLCKWEVNQKEFKKYVLICEKLREIAKKNSGEVTVDYKTQLAGKDFFFEFNKIARCEIKVPILELVKNEINDLIKILEQAKSIGVGLSDDNQILITFYFPNVYINKGIPLKFND